MLFKDITILDGELNVREHMYVGTKDNKIEYIGETAPDCGCGGNCYGDEYDGKGKLLMSGLFNAHSHSPMALLRGYAENLSLQNWLNDKVFPFEDRLTGHDVYWGTLLCMAESLRFGIVSSSDMYYFMEDMVRAVDDSGAKMNIARGVTNFTDSGLYDLDSFYEMQSTYENYNNAADGRIKVDMSLHAEYTSNPQTAFEMAEYTKSIGANMQVHVSETASEHADCKKRWGMTPVEYLAKQGIFDTPTVAAHCVWLEGDDFEILKEKGVTVATCPISNLKLASGVCNVSKLLDMGINVAIGTDSVASNNNLNMFEEIKAFALLSKERHKDPTAITPQQALYAATFAGAKAQGRWDCGKLEEGCRADLAVLDISGPHMHPVHHMANNLVYSACGGDVVLTMVDGKVLYENGEYKTIDIEKTIAEVQKSSDRIVSELTKNALVKK